MPSYADEYAARHPELQNTSLGPVRLTISRGDSVLGPNGQYTYSEKWEQEEVMAIDAETYSTADMSLQNPDDRLVDTIKKRLSAGKRGQTRLLGHSLLVLDTNVLLSTLPFIMTFYQQCLDRNVLALSTSNLAPSPISLIIPHTVLSELDNLKTSSKGNVGPAARAVNNWILSALRTQKRQMFDVVEQGTMRRQIIPERSWVLHVENTAHTKALEHQLDQPASTLTPDEEIVRLAVSLKKQAGFEVFFCSDDTNARTRAEIDGLPTFSFRELVRDEQGQEVSKEAMSQLASDLIEQWQGQIEGFSVDEAGSMQRMEEDVVPPVAEETAPLARKVEPRSSSSKKTTNSTGRTSQHSIHAVKGKAAVKRKESRSVKTQRQATRASPYSHPSAIKRLPATTSTKNNVNNHITHQYPADLSTSSSMWATR